MRGIRTKRVIAYIVLMFMLITLTVPTVFASDDEISYKFKIYSYNKNGQESKGRYRQTLRPENPWKVQLQKSTKIVSLFWLEGNNGENVSPDAIGRRGGDPVYTSAYSSASQRTVYLTGENNVWEPGEYYVEGVWDEETW